MATRTKGTLIPRNSMGTSSKRNIAARPWSSTRTDTRRMSMSNGVTSALTNGSLQPATRQNASVYITRKEVGRNTCAR